jgi:hypothetical protein
MEMLKRKRKPLAFRYEGGGEVDMLERRGYLLDSSGNPVLDGSGQKIRASGEEDEEEKYRRYLRENPAQVAEDAQKAQEIAQAFRARMNPQAATTNPAAPAPAQVLPVNMSRPQSTSGEAQQNAVGLPSTTKPITANTNVNPLSPAPPKSSPPPKPPAPPKSQPAPVMGRAYPGKTAEQEQQLAREIAGRKDLERRKQLDKPLEPVYPEMAIIPGMAGAKIGGKIATSLPGAAGKKAGEQVAKTERTLITKPPANPKPEPKLKPETKPEKSKTEESIKKLTGQKNKKSGDLEQMQSRAQKSREALLTQKKGELGPARRPRKEIDMGPVEIVKRDPLKLGKPEAKSSKLLKIDRPLQKKRDDIDDDILRFEGEGGRAFKKGGAVHNKKIDGIAIRGKTRFKYR